MYLFGDHSAFILWSAGTTLTWNFLIKKSLLCSLVPCFSPRTTARALESTLHMAPRRTPLCWLSYSPLMGAVEGSKCFLTCLGTMLQLTLGTERHRLRGTFSHSCTSMSAHLSRGTSLHSCRGTSLQSSLGVGWGKVASPRNLLTSLCRHQGALLPLHLLALFPERVSGQG